MQWNAVEQARLHRPEQGAELTAQALVCRGFFELVIKVYPDGKMSQHMGSLEVGDALECKGPIIKLECVLPPSPCAVCT